jgi:hypothetical protein
MNEFVRNLLSIFSILECSSSLSLAEEAPHREEVELPPGHRPACWGDIRPVFRLLTRGLATSGIGDLSHIVILVHGFDSRPAVWADGLARAVLTEDGRQGLMGVLVVDWEEAARWVVRREPSLAPVAQVEQPVLRVVGLLPGGRQHALPG